eukprot:comp20740_c0_seq1/m.27149 comp20740_c0_seq1/g.27149  ORF comp20740_c0_seq1/g.27149 comp20740_c0_seq1/m.27149 type:complete len:165 (-) comp20740_c0_seq1:451-945(-)
MCALQLTVTRTATAVPHPHPLAVRVVGATMITTHRARPEIILRVMPDMAADTTTMVVVVATTTVILVGADMVVDMTATGVDTVDTVGAMEVDIRARGDMAVDIPAGDMAATEGMGGVVGMAARGVMTATTAADMIGAMVVAPRGRHVAGQGAGHLATTLIRQWV